MPKRMLTPKGWPKRLLLTVMFALSALAADAQFFVAPRGFANFPLGAFGDNFKVGVGGSLGLGIAQNRWRYALNLGYTEHNGKNVPSPLSGFFDYSQLTLSADYQLSESTVAPFLGLEAGGAFGRVRLEGGAPSQEVLTNKAMVLVAPYAGARWGISERVSLDLFAKLNIFLLGKGESASPDDVFMSVPVGLGLNIGFGDEGGTRSSAATADRDGDGIADKDDRCPDEVGLKMYKGCPEVPAAEVKSLEDKLNSIAKKVLFATSSAVIEPGSFRDLDDLAKIMNKYPNTRFAIEGHTDNTGNAEANKKLSQERADAVKAYLSGKGIESSRLTATGYGQERPIGSNDTDEGRSLNRRVEIHLTK